MSATGWTPQDGRAAEQQVSAPQAAAWQSQGWQPPAAPLAPSRPAGWSAPTHPGPATNLLAVLAIGAAAAGATVFLGLGSIAAIVLGLIALGQIKRTGDDGRLLAVWAIIAGAVTLAALIASVIMGVAGFLSLGQQFADLGI